MDEIERKIIEFVMMKACLSEREITLESDLLNDLKIDGDDYFELIEEFSQRFNIDKSQYRWHYHHNSEGGCNPLFIFYNPFLKNRTPIPIRIKDLVNFVRKGKIEIQYPEELIEK